MDYLLWYMRLYLRVRKMQLESSSFLIHFLYSLVSRILDPKLLEKKFSVENSRRKKFLTKNSQIKNSQKKDFPNLTYTKIGSIQRRLTWSLRKHDTRSRKEFHIFNSYISYSCHLWFIYSMFTECILSKN